MLAKQPKSADVLKHGETVRVIYRQGHAGQGIVMVLENLPHGLLARLPWREEVSYIPWTAIERFEKAPQ